jgi:hypothetical protein
MCSFRDSSLWGGILRHLLAQTTTTRKKESKHGTSCSSIPRATPSITNRGSRPAGTKLSTLPFPSDIPGLVDKLRRYAFTFTYCLFPCTAFISRYGAGEADVSSARAFHYEYDHLFFSTLLLSGLHRVQSFISYIPRYEPRAIPADASTTARQETATQSRGRDGLSFVYLLGRYLEYIIYIVCAVDP